MKICPICLEPTLETDDVNDAEWVALGEAVCGFKCHQEAYDFVRDRQLELPLSTGQPD